MALHKLIVDDFIDESYVLLAIHCIVEDFRVAYLLNYYLNINLQRKPQDLDFKYVESSYSIFEWKDTEQLRTWNLVSNICKKEEESLTSSGSLFTDSNKIIKKHNLIPELKNVNFLLKISHDGNVLNEKTIITKIQEIPQIATVYSIDLRRIKYKDNLIFN